MEEVGRVEKVEKVGEEWGDPKHVVLSSVVVLSAIFCKYLPKSKCFLW